MNFECFECIEIFVLLLCDVVVYLYMVIFLFVGWEKFICCFEVVMDYDKKIMLVVQKEVLMDELGVNDFFIVGIVVFILQMLKLLDGIVKVLVEGLQCVCIFVLFDNGEYFLVKVEYFDLLVIDECEQEVLVCIVISQFEGYIKLNKKILLEVLMLLNSIDDLVCLVDIIVVYMLLKLVDKQFVFEMFDVNECLEYLMVMMELEIDLLQVEKCICNCVKKQMEKFQCEYYLNE